MYLIPRLMILQIFLTPRETCLLPLDITYIINLCSHDIIDGSVNTSSHDANQSINLPFRPHVIYIRINCFPRNVSVDRIIYDHM
jgi:hypothetical protein